jgi:hypothetical protein
VAPLLAFLALLALLGTLALLSLRHICTYKFEYDKWKHICV